MIQTAIKSKKVRAINALQARAHLACISGPDIGCVIPAEPQITLGREGDTPLDDPALSRHHCLLLPAPASRRGHRQCPGLMVVDLGSSHGTRITRYPWPSQKVPTLQGRTPHRYRNAPKGETGSLHHSHSVRERRRISDSSSHLSSPSSIRGKELRYGDRLAIGDDVFILRPRPSHLQWPTPPERRFHFRWALTIVPFLLFLGWRLAGLASWVAPLLIGIALATLGGYAFWAVKQHRLWSRYDGSHLALVLASQENSAASASDSSSARLPHSMMLWPGVPGPRGFYDQLLSGSPETAPSRRRVLAVTSVGFIGAGAPESALWWAGQAAARLGGATIVWEGQEWVFGSGKARIVIVNGEDPTGDTCVGESAPTIRIGFAHDIEDLPPWCDQVVVAHARRVSRAWWHQVARGRAATHSLPERISAQEVWRRTSPAPRGLDAIVGVNEGGVAIIDLVRDGPHALLAGTTGAGKSEALMTWIISMCRRHSPQDLQLVLIDYKGGATFSPLASLPHCSALLTDLAADETERALHGLRSMLIGRENALSKAGFPDLPRWEQAYRHGNAPHPPARVVVIVDEFRELCAAHPHAVDSLVRLAGQGRSLGLHLIIATQKGGGSVSSHLRANLELRIALRCAEKSDSIDLIGSPAAADLPRLPGRALIRGGGTVHFALTRNCEEMIGDCQSKWASYRPEPLWAPSLPTSLSWDEVSALGERKGDIGSGIVLGMGDGLADGCHWPWIYEGGAILFEGSRAAAQTIGGVARAIASRIAVEQNLPLHLVALSAGDQPDWALSRLGRRPDGVIDDGWEADCAHLFVEVADHGPSVVCIDDFGATISGLEMHMGAAQAREAIHTFIRSAVSTGLILIMGAPGGIPHEIASACETRCIQARNKDELLRAGISGAQPIADVPGRFLLVGPSGPIGAVQVPLEIVDSDADYPPEKWRVRAFTEKGSCVSPLKVGSALVPLMGPVTQWVVVGEESSQAVTAIHHWNEIQGLKTKNEVDLRILPSNALTTLRNDHADAILIPSPTEEVFRSLSLLYGQGFGHITGRMRPKNYALAIIRGRPTRLQIDLPVT
ncbi:MAG: FtsK/SpoIIIE domain-containing protein [Actinomycetaceae bacterium]|nr:FtsK/SpoIIIE domain-containing protein [Actinomycetaceae bacterium]